MPRGRGRFTSGTPSRVVPLHHPIRLAEEIAWLTHLSAGRLLVGIGSGFSPFEFGAYGVPLEERHERLGEGSAVIRGLLAGGVYRHSGKYWAIPPVTLRPRPFGGAAPRFLRASSGEDSLRAAASSGEAVIFGLKPLSEIEDSIERYRSIRAAGGSAASAIDDEIGEFRVLRRIVVAESDDEAREDARKALAWEADTARSAHETGRQPAAGRREEPVEIPGSCVGSPGTVFEGLRALSRLGVRHVLAWLNFGDLPYSKVQRSMELLARDVIPRLSESPLARGEEERKVEAVR